jgi:hypothetical protein
VAARVAAEAVEMTRECVRNDEHPELDKSMNELRMKKQNRGQASGR